MKHHIRIEIFLLILVSMCFLVSGCTSTESEGSTDESAAVSDVAETSQKSNGEKVIVSMYTRNYTIEELMEASDLVVRGIVESADLLEIEGADGGEMVSTEYQVAVSEVLRGNKEEGAQISVRRIGNAEDSSTIYEGVPTLEKDAEYLFFLDDGSGHSGTFNTKDDYYYLIGNDQSVYVKETAAVSTKSNNSTEEYFISMEDLRHNNSDVTRTQAANIEESSNVVAYSDIKSKLSMVNDEVPANPLRDIDEAKNTYKTNLENGIISEEQYNEYMAELENPSYGEVVNRENIW